MRLTRLERSLDRRGLAKRIASGLVIVLGLPFWLGGCASLSGIPDDLTNADYRAFSGIDLSANLTVAQALAKSWRHDRNEAYDWVFWSNISFVPLAAGAGGAALYKGSHDLISGIGLAAGTLIGTNAMIGAGHIGSAYQRGIIGLECIYSRLSPYAAGASRYAAGNKLHTDSGALANLITTGRAALRSAESLSLTAPTSVAEERAFPHVVATLANNESVLAQAIANARIAVSAAEAEFHLFKSVAVYARDRIIDVDNIVATSIKPNTVNFASLSESLATPPTLQKPPSITGSTLSTPKPAAPPPAAPRAPHMKRVAKAVPKSIRNEIATTKNAANRLISATRRLVSETADFGLGTQEGKIASCVKNVQ